MRKEEDNFQDDGEDDSYAVGSQMNSRESKVTAPRSHRFQPLRQEPETVQQHYCRTKETTKIYFNKKYVPNYSSSHPNLRAPFHSLVALVNKKHSVTSTAIRENMQQNHVLSVNVLGKYSKN